MEKEIVIDLVYDTEEIKNDWRCRISDGKIPDIMNWFGPTCGIPRCAAAYLMSRKLWSPMPGKDD
jgi:hypothetical protein